MSDPRAAQLIALYELTGKFTPDTVVPTDAGWMTIRKAYNYRYKSRCMSQVEQSLRGRRMNILVEDCFDTLKKESL